MDELGSGVINVNKFIKDYGGGDSPQFIEGNTFKVNIPLGDKGKDEILIDKRTIKQVVADEIDEVFIGNTRGVKERMIEIIYTIYAQSGTKVNNLVEKLGVSERTIKEDLKNLSDVKFVVYTGSKKSGSYKLHDKKLD